MFDKKKINLPRLRFGEADTTSGEDMSNMVATKMPINMPFKALEDNAILCPKTILVNFSFCEGVL